LHPAGTGYPSGGRYPGGVIEIKTAKIATLQSGWPRSISPPIFRVQAGVDLQIF